MFLLSKLFTAWFLPPGLFILVLFIWSIILLKKKHTGIAVLMLLFSGLIYIASLEPVADQLILPLENAYPPINIKKVSEHDVYVVLGGGIHSYAPDLEGNGSPTGDALHRLVYAYRLYRIQPLPIIVSSGKGFKCQKPEATVMKRYLLQMGVSEKDIYMDEKSRNTYENAMDVKNICEKLLCKKIILITSAYHIKRAVYAFKHAGTVNLIPAPTDYKTNRTCYNFIAYMPNLEALTNTYRALHEYIGLIYYKLLVRV